MKKKLKIAFLSTWPELTDGIATFCENLALNIPKEYNNYSVEWKVLRLRWLNQKTVLYKEKIVLELDFDNKKDFSKAREYINNSDFDVVIVQFINSIYGHFGRDLFSFLDGLNKPVILVLHSVAMLKSQSQLKLKQSILKKLGNYNLNEVVMSKAAQDFLIKNNYISKKKVRLIYHGTPEFKKITFEEKKKIRKSLGFDENEKIIFTYGIIREDKGIDDILNAMKIINSNNPEVNVKFLLCGNEQDKKGLMTKFLKRQIQELNMDNQVKFINEFISQDDIGKYLQATDVFITMQRNMGLHSSGTLAYALSTGAAIISTPIIHAKELLKDNAGIITEVNDPKMLASSIIKILYDNKFRQKVMGNSWKIGRGILWEAAAKDYLNLAIEVSSQNK